MLFFLQQQPPPVPQGTPLPPNVGQMGQDMAENIQKFGEQAGKMGKAFAEGILEVLKDPDQQLVKNLGYVASGLAVLFVCLVISRHLFDTSFRSHQEKISKNSRFIFGAVFSCMLIGFMPQLFVWFDRLMIGLATTSKSVVSNAGLEIFIRAGTDFGVNVAKQAMADAERNAMQFEAFGFNLSGIGGMLALAMEPNKYAYTLSAIALALSFFNYAMISTLYLDVFLQAFVLKLIAPIAFALYFYGKDFLHDKADASTNGTILKLFKILLVLYLLIPIGLIVFDTMDKMFLKVCTLAGILEVAFDGKFNPVVKSFSNMVMSLTGVGSFIFAPMLLLTVIVKFTIISKITNLLWKLIL